MKLVSFRPSTLVSIHVLIPYVCTTTSSIHVILHHEKIEWALVGLSTVNALSKVADVGLLLQ